MPPRLAPQLQHDRLRRIGRIEPQMHEEFAILGNLERLVAIGRDDLHGDGRRDVEAAATGMGGRVRRSVDPGGSAARTRADDRGVGPAIGEPERLAPARG